MTLPTKHKHLFKLLQLRGNVQCLYKIFKSYKFPNVVVAETSSSAANIMSHSCDQHKKDSIENPSPEETTNSERKDLKPSPPRTMPVEGLPVSQPDQLLLTCYTNVPGRLDIGPDGKVHKEF